MIFIISNDGYTKKRTVFILKKCILAASNCYFNQSKL